MTGVCPKCGYHFVVRPLGVIRMHTLPHGQLCLGSWQPPVQPKAVDTSLR